MARPSSPERARAAAVEIVRSLRAAGHVAYLAGGCVRDELLGLAPADYDVATDATPARIRAIFPRTAEVGEAFGVVLVTIGPARGEAGEAATVEVATFRSDGPYSDRRRPDAVTFSDARADAQRRDFTINALFLDPLADESHRVIDYVGGREDLSRRVIRAVGDADQRLAEDHLRALRAVRLAARLGFEIDPATASAIRRHAAELTGVSRERIGDEVRRMLSAPTRSAAAMLLESLGLDGPALTEPARGGAGAGGSASAGRVLAALSPDADYPTALAAWMIDRGGTRVAAGAPSVGHGGGGGGSWPGSVSRWRAALCLSNDERDALRGALLAFEELDSGRWNSLPVAGQKRAAAGDGFSRGLALLAAKDGARAAGVRARVEELAATGLNPPPMLVGDDLIAMGLKPGPAFKGILDRVYDEQLEGRVGSREAAVELARRLGV